MKKFSKFDTAEIKKGGFYEALPKNGYVIRILRAEENPNKDGNGSHIKIAFDIAEGEYKDFYKKLFDGNTNEDKKWPYDGTFTISVPADDSPQWLINNFGTFVAALEDSNPGYTFDWDETKWKGLVVGSLFRNEQSEYNGNIYDHVRPYWFREASAIRSGKFGRLPKDKLINKPVSNTDNGFMDVPAGSDDEFPF